MATKTKTSKAKAPKAKAAKAQAPKAKAAQAEMAAKAAKLRAELKAEREQPKAAKASKAKASDVTNISVAELPIADRPELSIAKARRLARLSPAAREAELKAQAEALAKGKRDQATLAESAPKAGKALAEAIRGPKMVEPKAKPLGKRAQAEADAASGKLPSPPDFSAMTHRHYRAKLEAAVELAKAGDIKGLEALDYARAGSRAAIMRYRDLALLALKAKAQAPAKAQAKAPAKRAAQRKAA